MFSVLFLLPLALHPFDPDSLLDAHFWVLIWMYIHLDAPHSNSFSLLFIDCFFFHVRRPHSVDRDVYLIEQTWSDMIWIFASFEWTNKKMKIHRFCRLLILSNRKKERRKKKQNFLTEKMCSSSISLSICHWM